jgi:DNA-binding beta-propeller fold protein YncE
LAHFLINQKENVMRIKASIAIRATLLILLMVSVTVLSSRSRADTGTCGGVSITLPFTDVAAGNIFFCSIAEAYFSGLSNGTDATHYSPAANVPREQMAAFVTRTMDQSLKRGSRRAALKQFWTPTSGTDFKLTTVGSLPKLVESDGADLWVASRGSATVSRVRASDGKLLDTWIGATEAVGVLAANGLIYVTGFTNPGSIYLFDPSQTAGAVTTLPVAVGALPQGISFDGARVWTANVVGPSVSIVTLNPLSVSNATAGFTGPTGILYDGANMWVTDQGITPGKLFKLNSSGAIIQTVTVDNTPGFPVFDGTNIWVPNGGSNTVTVVRASSGAVLATLTGNGLNGPATAAFDGERILVTNQFGDSVSLWKAVDLSPLGSVSTGSGNAPTGACSDGLNFWITFNNTAKLARF